MSPLLACGSLTFAGLTHCKFAYAPAHTKSPTIYSIAFPADYSKIHLEACAQAPNMLAIVALSNRRHESSSAYARMCARMNYHIDEISVCAYPKQISRS